MLQTKKQKTITWGVFGIYLFLLAWLILFKFSTDFTQLGHMRTINLIPFKESVIVNGRLFLDEIIYNILVFVPFGVYVNIFKNDWSFVTKIIPSLCLSVIFEVVQFALAIGASDITDVIGNTLGGIIGLLLYSLFKKLFRNKSVTIINSLGLIIEILAFVMLGILLVANS